MTDLEYIRLTLNLPRRVILREALGTGDGQAVRYQTRLWPIIENSEVVRVAGVVKTRTTDYTIDCTTGLIIFVTAPANEAAIDADYNWSVFNDAQINELLDRYNDQVKPTMRDLVMALIANSDLFIKYTTGMESVDRTRTLDALKSLYKELKGASAQAMAQSVVWTQADIEQYERDVPWSDFISSIPRD